MTSLQGVTFLDHTADVGIAVEAPELDTLFHRAALGMLALLRGRDDAGPDPVGTRAQQPGEVVALTGRGPGLDRVLAAWLRELLFLHEVEHLDYVAAEFERLDEEGFRARVRATPAAAAAREIKGVTYHGLAVERSGGVWTGRVIFDV